jgi:hypothetical protein
MRATASFWSLVYLLALHFIPAALSTRNVTGDSWSNVTSTSGYQLLPDCAKPCVLNVDSLSGCDSFGCVCSQNTYGPEFIAGVTNITSCAKQTCKSPAEVDIAVNTFRDICLVAVGLVTDSPVATSTLVSKSTTIYVVSEASTPTPGKSSIFDQL